MDFTNQKVVVTTDADRRGVFCGVMEEFDSEARTCVLRDARMVIHWSDFTRGVLGLASIGPQEGSRVTPAIPILEIDGITAVMGCTDLAWSRWEAEPWDN